MFALSLQGVEQLQRQSLTKGISQSGKSWWVLVAWLTKEARRKRNSELQTGSTSEHSKLVGRDWVGVIKCKICYSVSVTGIPGKEDRLSSFDRAWAYDPKDHSYLHGNRTQHIPAAEVLRRQAMGFGLQSVVKEKEDFLLRIRFSFGLVTNWWYLTRTFWVLIFFFASVFVCQRIGQYRRYFIFR